MKKYFKGDLCQMANQLHKAKQYGFSVNYDGGIPYIEVENKSDFIKLLSAFWISRINGYWHYDEIFFENDICTKYEFWSSLEDDNIVKLYHFEKTRNILNGEILLNGKKPINANVQIYIGDTIDNGKEIYTVR